MCSASAIRSNASRSGLPHSALDEGDHAHMEPRALSYGRVMESFWFKAAACESAWIRFRGKWRPRWRVLGHEKRTVDEKPALTAN